VYTAESLAEALRRLHGDSAYHACMRLFRETRGESLREPLEPEVSASVVLTLGYSPAALHLEEGDGEN
jgi:hypothetical protein